MNFVDYQGNNIELSEKVWVDHIQANHPDIGEEDIRKTLLEPDEVWLSQHRIDTELFYKKKDPSGTGKIRFWMVAVKKISTGNFVSTATTKSTVVGSKLIYKRP